MCWPYRITLLFKPFSSSGAWTNEERVTSQDGVGDSTVTGPAGPGRRRRVLPTAGRRSRHPQLTARQIPRQQRLALEPLQR